MAGDAVRELDELIGGNAATACLELSELRSMDERAVALLRRLIAEGTVMQHIPAHLVWRIERE